MNKKTLLPNHDLEIYRMMNRSALGFAFLIEQQANLPDDHPEKWPEDKIDAVHNALHGINMCRSIIDVQDNTQKIADIFSYRAQGANRAIIQGLESAGEELPNAPISQRMSDKLPVTIGREDVHFLTETLKGFLPCQ